MKLFPTSLLCALAVAASGALAQASPPPSNTEATNSAAAAETAAVTPKSKAERREAHRRIRVVHRHRIR